jgi:hypothetical protein
VALERGALQPSLGQDRKGSSFNSSRVRCSAASKDSGTSTVNSYLALLICPNLGRRPASPRPMPISRPPSVHRLPVPAEPGLLARLTDWALRPSEFKRAVYPVGGTSRHCLPPPGGRQCLASIRMIDRLGWAAGV